MMKRPCEVLCCLNSILKSTGKNVPQTAMIQSSLSKRNDARQVYHTSDFSTCQSSVNRAELRVKGGVFLKPSKAKQYTSTKV